MMLAHQKSYKEASYFEASQPILKHLQEVLFKRQEADGHWHFALDDNVTMNAEQIFFLHWMNEAHDPVIQRLAQGILNNQSLDGSWSLYADGPGNLSASIESYFALRLAGFTAENEALVKARSFILNEGGLPKARVFTKIWLALFGLYPWEGIPMIPPEIMMAPRATPFHINEFSYWSRTVIIPLTILFHEQRIQKTKIQLDELYLHQEDKKDLRFIDPIPVDETWIEKPKFISSKWIKWDNIFNALNSWVNFYENLSPVKLKRLSSLKKAEKWILNHQDSQGDWGGIVPAMQNSVMALYALGYSKDSEPVKKGMLALRRLTRGVSESLRPHAHEKSDSAVLQSCVSPVWDSCLSGLALLESGVSKDHPAIVKAKDWLWAKRITRRSDWTMKSRLKPSENFAAWSFQYFNEFYPDLDDTAMTTLFLHRAGMSREELEPAIHWMFAMQNDDGGWGTFDRNNNQWILNQIPFADLKSLIDPSNPDCTGHVLEVLGELGFNRSDRRIQKAVDYLKAFQRPDGSWFGRWGVHTIYGSCAAVVGMRKIGEPIESSTIQRGIHFILNTQNSDGGWGENCNNYAPSIQTGVGVSTPSQTAWSLMLLESCQKSKSDFSEPIERAMTFLKTKMQDDGLEEKEFTGTGFPMHFYLRYDGYRVYFPLIALGRLMRSSR